MYRRKLRQINISIVIAQFAFQVHYLFSGLALCNQEHASKMHTNVLYIGHERRLDVFLEHFLGTLEVFILFCDFSFLLSCSSAIICLIVAVSKDEHEVAVGLLADVGAQLQALLDEDLILDGFFLMQLLLDLAHFFLLHECLVESFMQINFC